MGFGAEALAPGTAGMRRFGYIITQEQGNNVHRIIRKHIIFTYLNHLAINSRIEMKDASTLPPSLILGGAIKVTPLGVLGIRSLRAARTSSPTLALNTGKVPTIP